MKDMKSNTLLPSSTIVKMKEKEPSQVVISQYSKKGAKKVR